MYQASFRRKSSAVSLCKSIESAIQWFQTHHGITFVTIHNPAVYLSGARVSISPTLVPRLLLYNATTAEENYQKNNLICSQARCSAVRNFVNFDNRHGNHSADGIFNFAALAMHFVVKSSFSRLSVR